MQLDWLNGFNTSNNNFMTSFNKLRRAVSLARQVTHQGLIKKNIPHLPQELDAMGAITS
jgi:hypothetical protein